MRQSLVDAIGSRLGHCEPYAEDAVDALISWLRDNQAEFVELSDGRLDDPTYQVALGFVNTGDLAELLEAG